MLEIKVMANSIAINTGKLFSSKSGLLVNENSVEEYAAEKMSSGTPNIIRGLRLSKLSQKLLFAKRTATGAARIDNL